MAQGSVSILVFALGIGALLTAIVVLLAVRFGRRASPGQAADSGGERWEAVANERAARISQLETEMPQLKAEATRERDAKAFASEQCSAAVEARKLLEERLKDACGKLDAATVELGNVRPNVAALTEALEREKRQAEEKLKLLTDAKDLMTQQFKVLSNELMTQHGETFKKANSDQMELILKPLREKIGEFQKGLQDAHKETATERGVLGEQIKALAASSALMMTETVNLTKALKGGSKVQGIWGEMVLDTLLEQSGLRKGEEYEVQAHQTTEEGERQRPDVIVKLPAGQHVVIDSKVSLTAYEAFINAETDEDREERLGAHVASLRAHIKGLSRKQYHATGSSSLDYVLMFVPIEGAVTEALRRDPSLSSFSVESGVALVTPTILLIALRTIDNVWRVERRNRNAEQIADRAGKLYDKFVSFTGDLSDIGNRINQARGSYDAAMGKLSTGSGNLVRQVQQLKLLGARTSKSIPSALQDDEVEEVIAPLTEAAETPGLLVGSLGSEPVS